MTHSTDSESDTCGTHEPDSFTIRDPIIKNEQNELSVVIVSSPLAESGAFFTILFRVLAYTRMSELMECFQNSPRSLANCSVCRRQYHRRVCKRYVISIRYELSIHMV